MPQVTVKAFYEHAREALRLRLWAGKDGLERILSSARIQKPGLALAGYTRFLHHDRVQILGETELSFLATLTKTEQAEAIAGLVTQELACIVITKGLSPPKALHRACDDNNTPLFVTGMTSSECIRKLLGYLDDLLSPRCSIHGVLVEVNGIGVLVTGSSGIGKSETALDLVLRGHRLVADDVVEIRRRGEDLVGQASELIQNLIEIRGLGILNVAELYGVSATRDHKRIELHVELEAWSPNTAYDRIGLEATFNDILGIKVRSLLIPVQPGRSIASIVEVAARNFLLQVRGHHAARELNRRILSLEGRRPRSHTPATNLRNAAELSEVTDHIEDEVE